MIARLARLRPRAQDRLRPRVRAGAADGHRAGARAAAAAPGNRARLERVHGDALRPDPPRPLQGDAGHDRDDDLGRAAPRGRRRPRASRSADATVELTTFEEPVAKVVDSVVDTEGERLSKFREEIERDRTANSKRFTSFKEDVTAEIEARGWYLGPGPASARSSGIGVFAVAGGRPALARHPRLAPGRAALERRRAGRARRLRGRQRRRAARSARRERALWRRRTQAGQAEAERWEAFRRYLTDFPRLQEAPPATLELWERFLVYGIAFGIAERVLQGAQLHMPEELHDQSTIYWISPTGDLGSGAERARDRRPRRRASARRSRRRPRAAAAAASPAVAEEAAAEAAAAPGSYAGFSVSVMPPTYACCGSIPIE